MTAIIPDLSATGCGSRIKNNGCTAFVHKHRMRAIFRATAFLALIATISVINYMCVHNDHDGGLHDEANETVRRIQGVAGESNMNGIFQKVAEPAWLMAPYIVGVLYMFLALAIVCDEYFVPALEVMSGEYHLNLTPDISGATLMAAGGSAPELFTSFIGTFQESEVGFGTIVGSAVFNVLFVIGMCSLMSKETLTLTWWPLFRDSTYYAIGLLVLAIFVGVVTPGLITWWESFVLFLMYIGYIFIMSKNERLYKMISGKDFKEDDEDDDVVENVGKHITFRTGLLTLIREPNSWIDRARIGLVAKVSGNVDDVFDFVDENGDGSISRDEIKLFLQKIEGSTKDSEENQTVTEEEVDKIMSDIDTNKDGLVSKNEFKTWYIKSEEHISKQIKMVFDRYDGNESGTIYKSEFRTMLKEVEPDVEPDEIEDAITQCFKNDNESELPFKAFSEWYLHCSWYLKHAKETEEDLPKSVCENLLPPCDAGFFGIIKYLFLFPIVATLTLTIPDVRRPGLSKGSWCYVAFVMSILWIGIYSYFMVGWAETIGNTLGIDSFIMGLTFLAAGTSVPDLLSSVIVARMGEGDMAVSSSIGSNIFDILVGLPIPWLTYALWPTMPTAVVIGAEGVWVSIMILLGMLFLIVITIHCSGWKLTKTLGFTMFFFYFCFLAQAILRWLYGK